MAVLPPTVPAQARLADLLLAEHGGLVAFITESRSARKSWDWIARELYLRTNRQVDATGPTIADWAGRINGAA